MIPRFKERAEKAKKQQGKLGRALQEQNSLSQAGLLQQNASNNLGQRAADQKAALRNWD
ncbi:hypothetical protein K470DRAFT_260263 [Piedraia hortae CBS 480.64]|uniref:Uncharacterized protein n=1 Tax=Piedraia hortae CBS 480.64 TaxID=1314780 RepID=A0A6A7BRX2_9PEZI|nr:hypothetical protein K470DRAFT_260263 [Piedraia hortae CBS 480.64]